MRCNILGFRRFTASERHSGVLILGPILSKAWALSVGVGGLDCSQERSSWGSSFTHTWSTVSGTYSLPCTIPTKFCYTTCGVCSFCQHGMLMNEACNCNCQMGNMMGGHTSQQQEFVGSLGRTTNPQGARRPNMATIQYGVISKTKVVDTCRPSQSYERHKGPSRICVSLL